MGRSRAVPGKEAEGNDATERGRAVLGRLHPCVPYQPIPGLVALFTRTASLTSLNPRAPHSRPFFATSLSYADIVRSPMEGGRFNGASRSTNQRLVESSSGPGSGQGLAINRGGF
jgi:hypothetical protein